MLKEDPFLKSLVESLPDMVWAFDKDYILHLANPAFLDMRNNLYQSELKVGDSLFKDVPEQAKNRWKPIYDRVLKGERIIMEEVRHLNGLEMMVKLSLNPVYDYDGTVMGCVGITYDMSNESKMEIALNQVLTCMDQMGEINSHDIQPRLNKFFALSEQLQNTNEFSIDDQRTIIYLINEELGQLSKKLQEISYLLNAEKPNF